MVTTRKKLLQLIDQQRVRRAIEDAESRTSGEIRVSVAPLFWGSVEKAAKRAFDRLGMTRTKDRLVLTRCASRGGKSTRGHQFLDEMGLIPTSPFAEVLPS